MTLIWERLYLGSRLDAERLCPSNPLGISTVISLCEEEIIRRHPEINYLRFPVSDSASIEVGVFDAIIDAIAENIRWGKILVHCGSGWSRAPIIVAAWMAIVGYKNIDSALMEIAAARPSVVPSRKLLSSVRKHLR